MLAQQFGSGVRWVTQRKPFLAFCHSSFFHQLGKMRGNLNLSRAFEARVELRVDSFPHLRDRRSSARHDVEHLSLALQPVGDVLVDECDSIVVRAPVAWMNPAWTLLTQRG